MDLSDLYRAVSLKVYSAGGDKRFALAAAGTPVSLDRISADYLNRCRSFRGLEEHAAAIARSLGAGSPLYGAILEDLRFCAERGLLLPYSRLVTEAAPADRPERISSFGLVSADRCASAKRALISYMDNARVFGRSLEWALYDDSRDPDKRLANIEMARGLSAERGAVLRYAGLEEKKEYAVELAKAGFRPELLEFCLFGQPELGPTYGANHNARLLDALGELYAVSDDDTICEIGLADQEGEDTEPDLHSGDPTEFRFYPDGESARSAVIRRDEDYFALHERVLGRSAAACLSSAKPYPGCFDRADDSLLSRIASGARCVATQCGLAGDSGMATSLYYLLVSGVSRERLKTDDRAYRSYIRGRAIVRAAPCLSLCDSPPFMTYAVGLDNRFLLPPFLPSLRNSDGFFAAVLRVVRADSLIGALPRTIVHAPLEARYSDSDAMISAALKFGAVDALIALVRRFIADAAPQNDAAARLRVLGRYLMDVGALPAPELRERLVRLYIEDKTRFLTALRYIAEGRDGESDAWAADVDACAMAIDSALPEPETVLLSGLPGRLFSERLAVFSPLLKTYGELLSAWPDLIQSAKELKRKEKRLSRQL